MVSIVKHVQTFPFVQQPQQVNETTPWRSDYVTHNTSCVAASDWGCVCHREVPDRHFIPGIDALMRMSLDKAAISFVNQTANCNLKTHFREQRG